MDETLESYLRQNGVLPIGEFHCCSVIRHVPQFSVPFIFFQRLLLPLLVSSSTALSRTAVNIPLPVIQFPFVSRTVSKNEVCVFIYFCQNDDCSLHYSVRTLTPIFTSGSRCHWASHMVLHPSVSHPVLFFT